MAAALRFVDEHAAKTDVQFLSYSIETILAMLWEVDEQQGSFWSTHVLSYFRSAAGAGYLAALVYDIRRSLDDEEVQEWLRDNDEAVKAYRQWHEQWKP